MRWSFDHDVPWCILKYDTDSIRGNGTANRAIEHQVLVAPPECRSVFSPKGDDPMRAKILAVTLIIVTGVMATAALGLGPVRTIPLAAGESHLTVVDQTSQEMRFSVRVGNLAVMDVQTKEGPFTRLFIPGFHSCQVEGAPELPMMNRLIAVPAGAEARIVVDRVAQRRIKLADAAIAHRIFPAQPSLPKNIDPADFPFVLDESAYRVKAAPQLVSVASQGRLRALDVSLVQVAPVSYDPAAGELEVAEEIEFRVVFTGGDPAARQRLQAVTNSPFFAPVYARVEGAKGLHDSYPDRVADVVTMVIVTPPDFEAQLADFVAWKTARGFRTIVAVTGTPAVGSTTSSIQSYLHGLYNGATVEEPAPSFVLFVGDVAQLPTFTISGNATDRPYCAVDGDLLPDMYYGRFSATNASQLQAMIDKTLVYEQYTMADPGYLAKVTLVSGVDSYYAATHGNGQLNYGTTHYFNAAHGITSNTWLYPASSGSGVPAAIVQTVSDGVAFINYTAHGSQTSWSNPSFTQANVNALTNSGKYCLAVGNCCQSGTYNYNECFGETWLRAADKGAIGYIGGSNNTYWNEDYWWGVGFHAAAQIDGSAKPYASTGLGAYDGLFHDHGEAQTQWYTTNDAIVFCGNLAVMESGSYYTTYYWNIYNLLGDPSVSTYLGVPSENPVTVSGLGPAGVTVCAAPGSYVGLTQDGVLIGAGTVGPAGSVDIDFTTPPSGGLPVHMVVTAQNRVPVMTDLGVATPAIALDATFFSERLETGETASRNLGVSNPGEEGSVLVFTVDIQADTGPPSADGLQRAGNLDGSGRDTGQADFAILQSVAWLTVTPAEGSVAQGSQETLAVDFDATGLAPGIYSAHLVITHNVSAQPETVPVTLEVTDPLSGGGEAPLAFQLAGSQPNPFNPATAIVFAIAAPGQVQLQIIDPKGRVVRDLVCGPLAAGRHTVQWDGRDEQGRSVASGLYLARLRAGQQEAVAKLTLAR